MNAERPSGCTDGSSPRSDGSRIAGRRWPSTARPSGDSQIPLPSGPRRFSVARARSTARGSTRPGQIQPMMPHIRRKTENGKRKTAEAQSEGRSRVFRFPFPVSRFPASLWEGIHQPRHRQAPENERSEDLREEAQPRATVTRPEQGEKRRDQQRINEHDQEVVGGKKGGHHSGPSAVGRREARAAQRSAASQSRTEGGRREILPSRS